MRIFILGLDGLEYDFVKPRDYPALKQEEYGKTILPKSALSWFSEFEMWNPYTPTVWTSFLTGEPPEKHGITRERVKKTVWNNQLLNMGREHRSLRWLIHHIPKWRGIFSLLGLRKANIKDELRVPTIFDYAGNPIRIQVPVVDSKWEHKAPLGIRKKPLDEIIQYLEARFMKIKRRTFDLLDSSKPWDLFMSYASILDWAGHAYWGLDDKMEEYYDMAEDFALEIQKRLDQDAWMLIVSDHGIMRLEGTRTRGGMHSYHAYWSSNRELGRKEIGLMEFFPMITKHLPGKPFVALQEDEEKIKERLKQLGYI